MLLVSRSVLGAVLLLSGASKVAARGWGDAAAAFAVPRLLRPAVPASELVIGGALVTGLGTPWTALAAIGLLAAFSAVIAVHLARHQAVPCGCFGDMSKRPVAGADLVRNAGLAALAIVAARPPHPLALMAFAAAGFGAGAWLALQVRASSRRHPTPS